jgi:hypothetical protein
VPSVPAQEVCPVILRYAFNGGEYHERATRGRIRVNDGRRQRPAPPSLGEPPGTVSGMYEYRLPDGTLVARAHRYLRPDGRFGGGLWPDPKWMLAGHVALTASPSNLPHNCDVCQLGNLGPPPARRRS